MNKSSKIFLVTFLAVALIGTIIMGITNTNKVSANSGKKERTKKEKKMGRVLVSHSYDDIGEFDNIDIRGFARVNFSQSESETKVGMEYDQEIFDDIDVKVVNRTLYIDAETRDKNTQINMAEDGYKSLFTISSPTLNKITVSGVSLLELETDIKTERLNMEVEGVARIWGKRVECESFIHNINGAGKSDFEHIVCADLRMDISGAGMLNIDKAECKQLQTSISGAGKIDFDHLVCENLTAEVSGAGKIELAGECVKAKYSASGTAKIAAREMIAEDVRAEAHGTSKVDCYASKSIYYNSSTLSKVSYRGEPSNVNGKRIESR